MASSPAPSGTGSPSARPFIIEEAQADEIAGAVRSALDDVWSEVRPEGLAAVG